MSHRIIRVLISLVIIAAAAVGEVVYWESPKVSLRPTSGPPPAEAVPPLVTWTPASVTEIITPGETKRISVNFKSSENFRRASVVISPELASLEGVNVTIHK